MNHRLKKLLAGGFFSYLILAFLTHRYQRGPKRQYQNNNNLQGKIIIITGASAGIGRATARQLASYGPTIIFACRDQQKTLKVIGEIKAQTNNQNLEFMKLVLDDYESVKQFVISFSQKYQHLDILINNAGIAQWSNKFNSNHHELVFATNHLGPFLLTYQIRKCLNENSRVIYVSSVMHEEIRSKINFKQVIDGKYLQTYNITKYCGVLMSQQFQKLFTQEGIHCKVVALHPGVVRTELLDKAGNNYALWFIFKSIFVFLYPMILSEDEGSWTSVYTALLPFQELKPAGYYSRNQLSKCSKSVGKLNQGEELWQFSKQILNLE